MPATKSDTMRGLSSFITDMRNCKSREEEERRINKELANIRGKFKPGERTLDGYQKRKYVCKLLFIFLAGHPVDFGHAEAVSLLCSNRYSEKQMGYLFLSVLLRDSHPLMNLVVTRLKDDLSSRNPIFVNLALQCVANIGTREMAEHFAGEIPKLITSGETIDSIKQNAALCMLRLIRVAPELVSYSEWTSRAVHLINDPHLGVVTSAVSLIDVLVKRDPEEYKGCISLAVNRLSRLVNSSHTDLQDYTYYFVTAPWLCIKFLRLLQNYPPPIIAADRAVREKLTECLDAILKKVAEPPKSKKVQHPNARNAVLFEAINLIIHMDSDPKLLVRASNQLGQFLQNKETNLRYLALESLSLLATSVHANVIRHQETVISALKAEKDVSVRQRAVDLLYAMCDRSNAPTIVAEMLAYLETADYSIREEMVLKVAILSEKYASDYTWYVDTILTLIRVAGDYVSEEVWHRIIQIVINRVELQDYVAKTVFAGLQAPACHENMIKVGGYILGEFGNLIAADPQSQPRQQFDLLHSKYHLCSPTTRQLLLTTYVKFINLFPEIKEYIEEALRSDTNYKSSDVEIQQRAVEYLALSRVANDDILALILEIMPPFPERESSILSKLRAKKPSQMAKLNREDSQNGNTAPVTPMMMLQDGGSAGNNGEFDLLGLGEVQNGNTEALEDGLNNNDELTGLSREAVRRGLPVMNRDEYNEFICKSQGLLFENDSIQIGVKSEFKGSYGRLGIFYGNKASTSLMEFSVSISSDTAGTALSFDSQTIAETLPPGAQVQQMIHVECLAEFDGIPVLLLDFKVHEKSQHLCLYLPITLNKFLSTAQMTAEVFKSRWEALNKQGEQMTQLVVDAQQSMDQEYVKNRLTAFGMTVLEGVDPNPNNYTCAGIVQLTNLQVGVLLRIETARQEKKYRLTVLSTKPAVSKQTAHLLEQQL